MSTLATLPAENNAATRDVSLLETIRSLVREGNTIPAPTVDEIDACVADYESAERLYRAAQETRDQAKEALIALVTRHGSPVPNAEQSKRLVGRRNTATITTGTVVTMNEDAVDDLRKYCGGDLRAGVFDKLFAAETKHKLLDGARSVLAGLQLPRRTHEKLQSLFGRCFDIKPKSPSLKTVSIRPEKPARKPRRKAAA
jgi:hypothetical protein